MKKSSLLNLVVFFGLLLSCPLLAQEKINDPVYQDKQSTSESLISQRYGPGGYGSETEGYDSRVKNSENYQYGRYGPLGYGTDTEGH